MTRWAWWLSCGLTGLVKDGFGDYQHGMASNAYKKDGMGMGAAAVLLAFGVLLSRFMGLVRDKVVAYAFGASLESDLYFAAFVIPDFINYLLAGGYFSITLIPILSKLKQDAKIEAERFFGAVLFWTAVAATGAALLTLSLAPALVDLTAPGFSPEAKVQLVRFVRIITPAQIFFLVGACFTSLLYLRRRFVVPALAPLVYNGMIILFGVIFLKRGMEGFCWGVLAGAILGNCLLPLWAVLRLKHVTGEGFAIRPGFTHPELKRFVLIALPLMLGQSAVVLDEQFLRVFGSIIGEGAVSRLNYARRVMLVPVGVVAQAAGAASYPFLAALYAKNDRFGFDQALNTALKNTAVCIIPIAAFMIAVAPETITLLFMQGKFSPADVPAAAQALRIMLLFVGCWGVQQIICRAFYAESDTLTPALWGTAASILALPLYWFLSKSFGEFGAALAGGLVALLYTGLLLWLWRRRRGDVALWGLFRTLWRVSLLAGAAMLAAWPVGAGVDLVLNGRPLTAALVSILVSGIYFSLTYYLIGRFLLPDAAGPLLDLVQAKLKRRRQ